jgi:hypothetical protein
MPRSRSEKSSELGATGAAAHGEHAVLHEKQRDIVTRGA